MATVDAGMTPENEADNIRQLGDTADDLADRTVGFWFCLRTKEQADAYKAAVQVAVQVHGLKPVRWAIWFHGTEPAFVQTASWEQLATMFHADRLEWARQQAWALALKVKP